MLPFQEHNFIFSWFWEKKVMPYKVQKCLNLSKEKMVFQNGMFKVLLTN